MNNGRLGIARLEPWTRDEDLARRWAGSLDEECLKASAEDFALRVTGLAESLPMTGAAGICGDELLQSAALIRTNCRAAFQATSGDDLLCKLGVVAEEARECEAWLELLVEAEVVEQWTLDELIAGADELVAMAAEIMRGEAGNDRAQAGWQDCEVPYLRLRR